MSPELDESASIPRWRSYLLRTFLWGLGFGVGSVLALSAVYYYTNRPKGWDSTALRVKHVRSEELDNMDKVNGQWEETTTGIMFTADVENTTGTDITIPKTLNIMQAAKTGALHGSLLALDRDFFLPAHHVVSVILQNSDLCAAKVGGKFCFDNNFKDEGELVIFDDAPKYEIRIPITASDFVLSRSSNSTSAPPCKNGAAICDPWERDWVKGPKPQPGSTVTREGVVITPPK
jgi:hypothetical protein